MKVILTETVKKLGSVGDIVNVSAGFARNFIIPNKCGVLADEGNARNLNDKQKMLAKKVTEEKKAAQEVKSKIEGLNLTIAKKVGGNGRLFGTVTTNEISSALEEKGFDVEKRMIVIDTPIKTLGDFEVKAKLFQDVEAKFKVKVEMDAKQVAEMAKQAKMKKSAPKATEEVASAETTDEEESDTTETNE